MAKPCRITFNGRYAQCASYVPLAKKFLARLRKSLRTQSSVKETIYLYPNVEIYIQCFQEVDHIKITVTGGFDYVFTIQGAHIVGTNTGNGTPYQTPLYGIGYNSDSLKTVGITGDNYSRYKQYFVQYGTATDPPTYVREAWLYNTSNKNFVSRQDSPVVNMIDQRDTLKSYVLSGVFYQDYQAKTDRDGLREDVYAHVSQMSWVMNGHLAGIVKLSGVYYLTTSKLDGSQLITRALSGLPTWLGQVITVYIGYDETLQSFSVNQGGSLTNIDLTKENMKWRVSPSGEKVVAILNKYVDYGDKLLDVGSEGYYEFIAETHLVEIDFQSFLDVNGDIQIGNTVFTNHGHIPTLVDIDWFYAHSDVFNGQGIVQDVLVRAMLHSEVINPNPNFPAGTPVEQTINTSIVKLTVKVDGYTDPLFSTTIFIGQRNRIEDGLGGWEWDSYYIRFTYNRVYLDLKYGSYITFYRSAIYDIAEGLSVIYDYDIYAFGYYGEAFCSPIPVENRTFEQREIVNNFYGTQSWIDEIHELSAISGQTDDLGDFVLDAYVFDSMKKYAQFTDSLTYDVKPSVYSFIDYGEQKACYSYCLWTAKGANNAQEFLDKVYIERKVDTGLKIKETTHQNLIESCGITMPLDITTTSNDFMDNLVISARWL